MGGEWRAYGFCPFRFYLRLFSYFQTILRQNLLFLVAVILMLDVFYDHVKLIYLNCRRSSLERKKNLMRDGQRYTEYGKGEHKWITHNALGGAKIYWVQCSLSQAQVFYIFSRNKFILVKTTNFCFLLLCPVVLQFLYSATIIPISPWPSLTTKATTPGPSFHMVTRHVENSSKPCWRAFWRSLRW